MYIHSREVKWKGKNKNKVYDTVSWEMQEKAPVIFHITVISIELCLWLHSSAIHIITMSLIFSYISAGMFLLQAG